MAETLKGLFAETANAIREKTGKSGKIAANDFPNEIRAITSTIFPPNEIPDYVKDEASAVIERVRAAQTDKTITFLAVSDSHHLGKQNLAETKNVNTGNLHMAMAMKILAHSLPIDFVVQLGDATFGHRTTTKELLISQIEEINHYLSESYDYFPNFRTVGNHDTGEYYASDTGDLENLTGATELMRLVGSYNEGAEFGSREYGYCFRDFPDKHLRVICLNTCEMEITQGEAGDTKMSPEQLVWFARCLRQVGSKQDGQLWSVITLGHFPLDYGYTMEAAHILRSYIEGKSVTVNGTAIDYAGANKAKFIGHFHGHIHNYRTAKIQDTGNGQPAAGSIPFDAWEIATPNSNFYRANQYAGRLFYGIDFGESVTYNKTEGAEDTAFVVNVVDPEKQLITSVHYGAGRDRTIGYAQTVYYSITTNLLNTTLTNSQTSIAEGASYESEIKSPEGYIGEFAKIVMGGVDITDSAFELTRIVIPKVTGDIYIELRAVKPVSYTNQVPISTDENGNIYNGTGYRDRCVIDGSGAAVDNPGQFTATGFIPVPKQPFTIRVGGSASTDYKVYNTNFCFYDSNKKFVARYKGSQIGQSVYWGEVVDEPTTSLTWTVTDMTSAGGVLTNAEYLRFSIITGQNGAGLICTIDEPIE